MKKWVSLVLVCMMLMSGCSGEDFNKMGEKINDMGENIGKMGEDINDKVADKVDDIADNVNNIGKETEAASFEETVFTETESIGTPNIDGNTDFKAVMDAHEKFFDEYVEFVKKYKESGYSSSMMGDYQKLLLQYAEEIDKIDDIKNDELSADDLAYYNKVYTRIMKKLASVGQ